MHAIHSLLRTSLCVTIGLLLSGCGGGNGNPSDASEAGGACAPGEMGCTCYGNLTCNAPFVCSTGNLCMAPLGDVDGSFGTGGWQGTGGTPGGGGALSDGAVDRPAGSGGAPSLDAPLGTGGQLPGTGGVAGAGVDASVGSGGRPGTGGKPGTGGSSPLDAGAADVAIDAGPEPTLNGPCSPVGALACVGHAQKGMMMCDGAKWLPNGACTGSLLCDSAPGPTQGTCVAPLASCAGQQPGYSYCTGSTKVTCGPDLLTITSQACPFVCTAGQCTGECAPSSRDCDGQTPLACATNGTWLRGTICTGDCNKGTCCAASTPNLCNGACVDLQTSNANCGGCGVACATTGGKSCRAAICQCAAGMTDCSGTCVSLTSSSANCGACGKACEGGRTCQTGICACPSGTLDCGGTCINVQTDNANCGACGVPCPAASTCYAGTCGGENLIVNGDFSDGATNWQITKTGIGVTFGMSGTSYCVSLPSYTEAVLGWGSVTTSVAIAGGYGYTFSYTVSSTDALYTFSSKIGHTVSPYTAVFSTGLDSPVVTPTTFTHSFTPTYGDTSAGIAFDIYAGANGSTVCFANVSLVRH